MITVKINRRNDYLDEKYGGEPCSTYTDQSVFGTQAPKPWLIEAQGISNMFQFSMGIIKINNVSFNLKISRSFVLLL